MIAWRVWTLASAATTNILAGATAVLTAVMDANPIMLVVIALAALAAGLIYAYKHSEKFRELVINAFHAVQHAAGAVLSWLGQRVSDTVDFIQKHWRALLIILTGPIGAAIVVIHDHWNQIVSWTSGMIHSISDTISHGIDNVVGWFKALPGRIRDLRNDMLDAGKSLMEGIFSGLESAASAVGGFAANIATAIWHELEDVLNNILPHSLSINKGPIHITVPLFPMLAAGGVTDGMTSFVAGDNPGGREAVIPLDKYDIPKKGQTDQATHQAQQDNSKIIGLLSTIARSLADSMPEDVASALGDVLSNQSDANLRRQLQLGRAL
jgi:phage-related protein